MASIFTIERRQNLKLSFDKFIQDLQSTVTTSNGKHCKMAIYLNHCIRYWPYRCGAVSIEDYLGGIDVDLGNIQSERDLLLTLELYINLLYWAPKQDQQDNKNYILSYPWKKDAMENEAERLLQNIDYMLEQCCNMSVREINDDIVPMYHITKRNAFVDAAVMAAPVLSDVILGYYDIRNEDDLEYKKTALTGIYAYLEPRRKEFKELECSSVSEEFFAGMNNFGIRHNTKAQIELYSKKKKSVCDMLFMMAVYVLQTPEVKKYKDTLKELREKKTEK